MSSRDSRLAQLSPDEGTELIKTQLKGQVSIDDGSAANLAKKFAYYPLYIHHMTSFITSASLSLDQFYEHLESEPTDHELQDLCIDSPWYTESVAKAIGSHITKLRTNDPKTADTLTAIAFFDPDSIPERLILSDDGIFPSLSSRVKVATVLFKLAQHSFIGRNAGGQGQEECISMHRLVRDATLRAGSALQGPFNTAVGLLRTSFPLHSMSRDHMVEVWDECESFQPHVLSLHRQYIMFRDTRTGIVPTFEFIELVYSCAW